MSGQKWCLLFQPLVLSETNRFLVFLLDFSETSLLHCTFPVQLCIMLSDFYDYLFPPRITGTYIGKYGFENNFQKENELNKMSGHFWENTLNKNKEYTPKMARLCSDPHAICREKEDLNDLICLLLDFKTVITKNCKANLKTGTLCNQTCSETEIKQHVSRCSHSAFIHNCIQHEW